ncbi:MAG: VWA domain-containing protein, partial [Chlamydiia bacterium]|nr:VWA domain-containing protein [Chlamydiia bacterium]
MKKYSRFYLITTIVVAFVLLFSQCQKTEDLNIKEMPQKDRIPVMLDENPLPDQVEIPAATVKLQTYYDFFDTKKVVDDGLIEDPPPDCESSLMPLVLEATLAAGESVTETKTGKICGSPPKADIIALFDLTASMGDELNNMKVHSQNIMNAIDGVVGDVRFGIMSHMDYVGDFSGCDYSNTYGSAADGDYPYKLDQKLTSISEDVAEIVNGLTLGYGSDGPENYTRPLYESYSDPNIDWRDGSKKIIVAMLDNIPHDCDFDEIIGGSKTSGPDPGRDGVVGTGDDLRILEVLQGMKDNNITLIVLYTGSRRYLGIWQKYAEITGGTAFAMSYTGASFGDGDDCSCVSTLIVDLIQKENSEIDEVTLDVCTAGFEDWLVSVDPGIYTGIDLSEESPWIGEFDITVTVPEGTEDGTYDFDICLQADGVEYGRQHVTITVVNKIEVPFDIRPRKCPNNINRKSKGVVPAAILGFDG